MSRDTLNIDGNLHPLSKLRVWGILNVTAESFYDGGKYNSLEAGIKRVRQMLEDGADVIDIGAMSSRPGASISEPSDELKLLLPLIKEINSKFPKAIISIDTIHAEVANACLKTGAHMINDISGGRLDKDMYKVVSSHSAPYVMMHMRGTPMDMQKKTDYKDFIPDVLAYFKEAIPKALDSGMIDIIIDPGFGFSKSLSQNFKLIKHLNLFNIFDFPVMIGLSRKSTIWKTLDIDAERALNGTTAMHMLALNNGAQILRVHDVKEAKECVKLYDEYTEHSNSTLKKDR